jgi:cyclophilin family peptidyl-prolyl cis-trans isomerase
LFERHFYDGSHFFRVVPNFLVQFGISYSTDQELQALAHKSIPDDPKHVDPPIRFEPGIISYAGSGPNSRTSQLFISYGSAESLGTQLWETPIGQVIEGMENVKNFYSYGDMPPWGKGPVQGKIHGHPEYIENEFPLTDKFVKCHVERKGKADDSFKKEKEEDQQRELLEEEENQVKEPNRRGHEDLSDKQRHRDLRTPDMIQAQQRIMKEQQEAEAGIDLITLAAVAFAVAVLALMLVLLKGRRKVTAKDS